jgi:4,5-dihydroxyphthalate decarboxylase
VGKVRLSVACGDYDIVRPLAEGTVEAEGLDLVFVGAGMGSRERHWRMARNNDFDVCEINVCAHLMGSAQGAPLAGLPIFLHRRFRHGFVFVRTGGEINEPKDLIGKRIGGTNFQPAANVWMRGTLEEHYGLPHRSVTWVVERTEDVGFDTADDLKIVMKAGDKSLEEMLVDGEIDALLSPNIPLLLTAGDERIARLFPDYKAVEVAYFKKTGIFPIMHVNVIKQEIIDRHPWVAINLAKAFEESKNVAYKRVQNPRNVPLAWVRTEWEEERSLLGPDPWAYGLGDANRKNLEAIARYALQQGMIPKMPVLEELFIDTDLGDAGGPDER